MTSYVVLCFVSVCAAFPGDAVTPTTSGHYSNEASAIIYENAKECMATGAVCTRTEYCPREEQKGAELCGGVAGITCCRRLPTVMKSCRARGGECVPREECARHHAPIIDADCDVTQLCCVHV